MPPRDPTRDTFGLPSQHPLRRRRFWIGAALAAIAALIFGGWVGVFAVAAAVLCFAVVSWPVGRVAAPVQPMTRRERAYWIDYPDQAEALLPRARARADWDEVTGEVIEPPAEPVAIEPARRQIGPGR